MKICKSLSSLFAYMYIKSINIHNRTYLHTKRKQSKFNDRLRLLTNINIKLLDGTYSTR